MTVTRKELELLHLAKSKEIPGERPSTGRAQLSVTQDTFNKATANRLVRKGLMQNIMDTFWVITPDGEAALRAHKDTA